MLGLMCERFQLELPSWDCQRDYILTDLNYPAPESKRACRVHLLMLQLSALHKSPPSKVSILKSTWVVLGSGLTGFLC